MKVTIIETNQTEEIGIIDPKSGVNWINDLMGNYGALPEYNDDTDSYHMSQEDYDWWADLVDRYETADRRCFELRNELDWEQQEDFDRNLADALSCDLEDMPEYMHSFCDEFESDKN